MSDRYIPGRPRDRPCYDDHYTSRDRYDRDDRDDRYDRYDRADRYDERERYDSYNRYDRDERYRPPRRPRSPPRETRAQESGFSFRGAAVHDEYRLPRHDFSFRASGPRFPSPDRYAPPPESRPPPRGPKRDGGALRGNARRGGRGQFSGRGRRFVPPSSREILHESGRAQTPEQLEGMNTDGQVRFNALASSSEESDDGRAEAHGSSSEEEGEIRRKRFKVDAPPAPKPDAPKWSNPDPYSVLPPTEATVGPKKDIVQVIRKAKNDVLPRSENEHAVSQNADFISFNFDDGDNYDDDVIRDDMHEDKASSRERDPMMDDHNSETSSARLSGMGRVTRSNGNRVLNGSGVASFPLRPPSRDHAALPPPPPPFDLRSPEAEDRPQKRMRRAPSPIDLTGDDDASPSAPPSLLMPTDEEVIQALSAQPRGKKRKHEEQSQGRGEITEAWAVRSKSTNATPWCTVDRSATFDVHVRLHEEILDFFEFVRPHQHEEAIRQDLVQRVQASVRGLNANARNVDVKCFGSFAAGLYLPIADMDLVAVSPTFMKHGRAIFAQHQSEGFALRNHLKRTGMVQGGATFISKAKVPIVKFVDQKTGIKVDISFENASGLLANETFQQWKSDFPTMPVLVVIIKQLLAMRDLNEVFTGGLGGFSIICLVVSMLQLMPQDEWLRISQGRQPYADLLLRFLDLYGNQFDIRTTGIRMDPPGYFDKIKNPMRKQNPNNLTIMDPNNEYNDISGGSRGIVAVLEVFRKAHSQILQRMSRVRAGKDIKDSILGCVLGGNYNSFITQRNRLWRLYGGERVSPPLEPAPAATPRPQKRKQEVNPPREPAPAAPARPQRRKKLASINPEGLPMPRAGQDANPPASSGGPLSAYMQGRPSNNQGDREMSAEYSEDTSRDDSDYHPPSSSHVPSAKQQGFNSQKNNKATRKEKKIAREEKKATEDVTKKAHKGNGKKEKLTNKKLGLTNPNHERNCKKATKKAKRAKKARKKEQAKSKAA